MCTYLEIVGDTLGRQEIDPTNLGPRAIQASLREVGRERAFPLWRTKTNFSLNKLKLEGTAGVRSTKRHVWFLLHLRGLYVERLPRPGAVVHDPHRPLVRRRHRDDETPGDLGHVRLTTLILRCVALRCVSLHCVRREWHTNTHKSSAEVPKKGATTKKKKMKPRWRRGGEGDNANNTQTNELTAGARVGQEARVHVTSRQTSSPRLASPQTHAVGGADARYTGRHTKNTRKNTPVHLRPSLYASFPVLGASS